MREIQTEIYQLLDGLPIRIGKIFDLSDFDHGVIVGTIQGGLSISENADFLRLSCSTLRE